MSIEPELPYFPLPTEHERPTRRWGAYRADAVVTVDGVDWGFRYVAPAAIRWDYANVYPQGKVVVTRLPFVAGESKVFVFPCLHQTSNFSETVTDSELLSYINNLDEKSSTPSRVAELGWGYGGSRKMLLSLGFNGCGRAFFGENEAFPEQDGIEAYTFEHRVESSQLLNANNEELFLVAHNHDDSFLVEKIRDFSDEETKSVFDGLWGSTVRRNWRPTEYIFDEDDVELWQPRISAKPDFCFARLLSEQNWFEFMGRSSNSACVERLLKCILVLEENLWNEIAKDEEAESASAYVRCESQFSESSISYGYEDIVSNISQNLFDLILDEFGMTGVMPTYETQGVLFFKSFSFSTASVRQPSQHERMEALIQLKKWLLSVDVSEEDAELLLSNKAPKGWLAQQKKIKW